jgi:hypothetical protein
LLTAAALEGLKRLSSEDVAAFEGRPVVLKRRDAEVPFVAENFLLSFSVPNFFFHSATAYDILRSKGVPLAKRDFMGKVRSSA